MLSRNNSRRRHQKYRAWLDAVKVESGCVDCGFNAHPAALDFDHLPGTQKCFILASGANKAKRVVELEMAKCEIVCSNCHRIRTAERRTFSEG